MTEYIDGRRPLPLELTPQPWMLLSPCSGMEAYLPWTSSPGAVSDATLLQMQAVCRRCPVRHHCADFASSIGADAGFWAGRWRDPENTGCLPRHVA